MSYTRTFLFFSAAALPALLWSQLLDPALLRQAPREAWASYNGDYTGQRHSPLSQINASNVKSLTLAWTHRFDLGALSPGPKASAGRKIKATPLLVGGILYLSIPDHVWAVDARSGREIWHFEWRKNFANHVGNRGLGMYGDWLYYMTPDNYLVCLNAKDGSKRWEVQIADVRANWFSSIAPMVIGNHIIVAPGNDDDIRSFMESRDPETGKLQWRWWVDPGPGEPGSETWSDTATMLKGGGNPWLPGAYDPELNLYFFGTGNGVPTDRPPHPTPTGDSLYTACIVALNPETGKMAWYFQATPHDTHDWDSAQTPIIFDAEFKGQTRKLLAQASRNGYFFLLDRATGKNLVTAKFMPETNWAKGIDASGHPIPDYSKDANPKGTLVSPDALGATNWWAPSYDPKRGLFLVNAARSWAFLSHSGFVRLNHPTEYLTEAIDYRTGKVVWTHELGSGAGISGLLSTDGDLLFGGDTTGEFLAMDPGTGKTLWHTRLDNFVTNNGPITYLLDGQQYVLLAAYDSLYAFSLPR